MTEEVAPTGATLVRFTSFDGSEVAYLDEGTGPLAVLLHGFGSEHREMGVPTLVLTGADDWFVGPPGALAARIPGAVVRTVPGDHLTACDTPAFAAAIVEFVTAPTQQSEDTAP